jgi:hypothetical protein
MTITIKIVKKPAPENGTTPSNGNIDQVSNSVVLNPNSHFEAANNNLHKYEKVQPQPKKSAGASDGLPEPVDDVVLDDHGLPIERSALNCNPQPEDSNCEQSELRELPGIVDEECLDDDDSDPSEDERREIELTEDFVADAFVDTFWDRIRYDHTSGC